MINGKLYLIPTLLGDSLPQEVLPDSIFRVINRLNYYIAEDVRSARRFLKKAGSSIEIDDITFFQLNKYTRDDELTGFLGPALSGQDIGLLSEAGLPCIADPGSKVTAMAHRQGVKVIPLTGPSSLILALMASGLNGQAFVFHGYLPIKNNEKIKALKKLEHESAIKKQSQIFMETPYRNIQMFSAITAVCKPSTWLCIASDLTLESEFISTKTIGEWRKQKPDIHKHPAIFILQV